MQQILHKHSYKSTLYQYSFPCNHYDWAYCYNFCATIDVANEHSGNIAQTNIRKIPRDFRRRTINMRGVIIDEILEHIGK